MPGGIEGAISEVREKGGLDIFLNETKIVSVMGYFINKSELYIYFLAVDKDFRKNPVLVKQGLSRIYNIANENNLDDIQFKAVVSANYNNTLYARLAYKVEKSENSVGMDSKTYYCKRDRFRKYVK